MGKRELLLIAAFVVTGVLVYQVTAPAPAPGTEGASLSAIWRNVQRHVKGNQATATADSTQSVSADGIRTLRIAVLRVSTITVTGEDRSDVSVQLHVTGRGFDDPEARAVAAATRIELDRAGDAITMRLETRPQPRMTPTSQVTITVNVPRGFAVRVEPHTGPFTIAHVASVNLGGQRGNTRVSWIDGAAEITSAGGQLTIDGCGGLKLSLRGVQAMIHNPTAATSIEALAGRVQIDGVRAETRIDSRNTPIDLALAEAAPVTINSTAQGIVVTPPAAGYTLDAAATGGRITFDDGSLPLSTSTDEQRVSGFVRGGGPALVLRATHASIVVRAHPSGK